MTIFIYGDGPLVNTAEACSMQLLSVIAMKRLAFTLQTKTPWKRVAGWLVQLNRSSGS